MEQEHYNKWYQSQRSFEKVKEYYFNYNLRAELEDSEK